MLPPADRFYGDPFLFKKDGRTYLLFEEYPYPTAKGVISYVEIDENGRWNQPQLALERPYHLSYPFVFESDGEIYLIPETSANRTIELYRALDFPRRWALDRTLMTGVRAVDATVVQHHGKFWLFTCLGVGGASNAVELHLFHADALEGPWHPHRMNPVVSDVRHARPAGRLVHAGGELYRPAQDCSVRYGFAINFRRIKQLSEADYLEVPAGRLDPDWLPGNLATHTIDCNEDFIVLDARLHVREPRWRFREQSSSNRFADSVRAAESRASRIVMPWQGENWLGDCPRKAAHLDREPARIA
jgi:hypothetical protein